MAEKVEEEEEEPEHFNITVFQFTYSTFVLSRKLKHLFD